jgi:hypothetical protein
VEGQRRYEATVVSDEPAAQVGRLRYVLANEVKEGLVARVEDWPGISLVRSVLSGDPVRGTWFNRTAEHRARLRGEDFEPRRYRTEETVERLRLPFRWQVQVQVQVSGKPHRLGVEPDRVFGLRFEDEPEGRNRAFFFLEADRGTMPVVRKGFGQTSFFRKLLAYQETWRRGLHKAHLAIPNFRVLTVTTSN